MEIVLSYLSCFFEHMGGPIVGPVNQQRQGLLSVSDTLVLFDVLTIVA